MDQRNITNFLTFMKIHLAETLIVFLLWIAFTSAPVTGNSTVRGRLGESTDTDSREGILELTLDGGVNWYKLCDDDSLFDSKYFKIATVVCKQLGHGPPVKAEYFHSFDYDQKYLWYDSEWCNVDITEVSNCSLEGSSLTVPDSCTSGTINVECLPAEAEEYDVALVRDPAYGYRDGLVLIHVNGQWGPICYGSAGDTVCEELDYGPMYEYSFQGDASTLTYTPPVLGYLECNSFDKTVEECYNSFVMDRPCDPEMYVTVNCMERDYPHYDEDPPDSGGFSPSYLSFMVIVIIVMVVVFRVYAVRARAQQRQQNSVGRTGVPSLSSSVNRQRSAPSRFARANYPRQQTQSSSFQGYQPSGMPAADSAPPYPATSYERTAVPYPPPNDPDLPSYEDVVRGQTPT